MPWLVAASVLLLCHPCDPLGSSGDAASCSFCSLLKVVCASKSAGAARSMANRACSLHDDVVVDISRQWLADLACDASKIAYEAGSLGFVTLTTGNNTLPVESQWNSLRSVCGSAETKRAWRAACPGGKTERVGGEGGGGSKKQGSLPPLTF